MPRRHAWFGLAGALVLCALPCLQASSPDLVLTEVDAGKKVTAKVDQTVAIRLAGNPSTGFTWRVAETSGDSVVSTGDYVFTDGNSGTTGGGGTCSFPFLAVKPGVTIFSFAYLQPWNPESVLEAYDFTIEVIAGPTPPLAITLSQQKVLITWPVANSAGFFLEGTPTLQPADWRPLNVLPISDGTQYVVTLGHTGAGLYFRLRK